MDFFRVDLIITKVLDCVLCTYNVHIAANYDVHEYVLTYDKKFVLFRVRYSDIITFTNRNYMCIWNGPVTYHAFDPSPECLGICTFLCNRSVACTA